MTTGLVSVIIPVFNRPEMVCDAMSSVLKQSYRPIQLIVVNDGSTDDTSSAVEAWMRKYEGTSGFRSVCIDQDHGGACAARNRGLQEARGEFIQFLDSDCELFEDKLLSQVRLLEAAHGVSHCYGITEFKDNEKQLSYTLGAEPLPDLLANAVTPRACSTIAPLWRFEAVLAAGPWDETLACRQDWEFRFRAVRGSGAGVFVAVNQCRAWIHEGERISQHGSPGYAEGLSMALEKVSRALESGNGIHAKARNLLARQWLSLSKKYLRLRDGKQMCAAQRRAMQMASGADSVRALFIHLACLAVFPRLWFKGYRALASFDDLGGEDVEGGRDVRRQFGSIN